MYVLWKEGAGSLRNQSGEWMEFWGLSGGPEPVPSGAIPGGTAELSWP
jgi:hypothetical protein